MFARRRRRSSGVVERHGGGALMTWETVIGLEVHVQLGTRTKMFCGCRHCVRRAAQHQRLPGLPRAARRAAGAQRARPSGSALRAALALGCTVHPTSASSRARTTSIPTCPRATRSPSSTGRSRPTGAVAHRVAGARAHRHRHHPAARRGGRRQVAARPLPGATAVDLNRAGVPLAEIVSEPDLRSPPRRAPISRALKQILVYAGVSECNMEKGSLRVDANVSVRRPADAKLGTKTEVKNMNSFANVERALEAERERQIALLEAGGRVEQETLLFNADTGARPAARARKEESHDYRYFPDPDLPPLVLDADVDRGAARDAARAAPRPSASASPASTACRRTTPPC